MALEVHAVELPTGITMPFVEHGRGVPLLLVHAVAESLVIFEPLLRHLPDDIRVVVPTQRGHGDASKPSRGYRPSDYAADLAALMDALAISSAVVAGGSSGGVVARTLAIVHPDRVRGLVLIGSPRTLRGNPRLDELWESTFSKLEDPIDEEIVRGFVVGTVSDAAAAGDLEPLVVEAMKVPAHVWKGTMRGLMEDATADRLTEVRVPTLILAGEQDAILPVSDQEAMATAFPNARLVIYPGAGHSFYWDESEAVARDLAAFVRSFRD